MENGRTKNNRDILRILIAVLVLALVGLPAAGIAQPAIADDTPTSNRDNVYLPALSAGNPNINAADSAQTATAASVDETTRQMMLATLDGNMSAVGVKASVYLKVKGQGAVKDGIWSPLNEQSPSQARANMVINHHRNQQRLQAAGGPGSNADAESMDFDVDGDGTLDIAVIVDNGSIIIPAVPANPLDLQPGMLVRYTPVGSDSFQVELESGQALDATFGPVLSLLDGGGAPPDDGFEQIALTAPFPFLGTTYNDLFVGSDGHITFGVGDGASTARDAARHIGGPPRISALLADLDPSCVGTVHADVRTDRIVVTWNGVILFSQGAANGCSDPTIPTNTVQAILYGDGTVEIIFGDLDTAQIAAPGSGEQAVTGIAEGNAAGPLNEIDVTSDLPATFQVGAIYEQFTEATAENFDLVQLSREFYRTHDDKYDFLVTFMDFEIFGGGTAFSAGIKNETLGLGTATFDFSALLGSQGELENFLWMNNINLWAGNSIDDYINPQVHKFAVTTSPRLTSFLGGNVTPNTSPYELVGMLDITGPGTSTGYGHHGRAVIHENPHTEARTSQGALRYDLNSAISIMFQEADHRWAAFLAFVHPTKGITIPDSFDLLGRAQAHWSTFFNTRVANSPFTAADGMPRFSGMEGNALIQVGTNGSGDLIDQNDLGRIIADPKGEIGDALAFCQANGADLFLTEPDELIDGATELDQYLMGLRTADEVSPFWYVDDPFSPITGASLDEPFPTDFIRGSTFNVDDIGYCGTRVDLTVQNITDLGTILGIPGRGPRIPAIGDENDVGPVENCFAENVGDPTKPCVDVKTMAWILVVRSGPPNSSAHMPAIRRLNEFRLAWQQYTDGPALGGRNADGVVRPTDDPNFIPKFDTSLEPTIH